MRDGLTADVLISDSVCPNQGSIKLNQKKDVLRPRGLVELVCEFRVPLGQLSYYVWGVAGRNKPIYRFPVSIYQFLHTKTLP